MPYRSFRDGLFSQCNVIKLSSIERWDTRRKRERDDSTFNLNFHPLAELYNFIINFPVASLIWKKNVNETWNKKSNWNQWVICMSYVMIEEVNWPFLEKMIESIKSSRDGHIKLKKILLKVVFPSTQITRHNYKERWFHLNGQQAIVIRQKKINEEKKIKMFPTLSLILNENKWDDIH